MKNAQENVVSPNPKRAKLDPALEAEAVHEQVPEIERIQEELHALDELCAKEQMQIQKKFDEKKKPFFEKRQQLIEKIPNFWADALAHHPALNILTEHDRPLLEQLKRIELEDNLDDSGSYRVKFIFTDAIKEYFTPTTLVKHVTFADSQEEVTECTEIQWKENKEPSLLMRSGKSDEDDYGEWSLFEWFTTNVQDDKPDLGEVIRRELWHAPLSYYMGEQPFEDDDDDEDEELDDDALELDDEDDEGGDGREEDEEDQKE